MMRLLPRNTFGLVAALSVALALFAGVAGFGINYIMHERIERELDQRIADETRLLLGARQRGGTPMLIAAIADRERDREWRGMGYLYVDVTGRRLGGQLRATPPPPGWHEFLIVERRGRRGRGHAQSLSTAFADGSRLVVAADRRPVESSDRAIGQITVALSLAMLIVGIAAAWLLGAITRRRIDRLNATAQAIIDGDTARRMPRDPATGEFDRLAETLNRMLDRNVSLTDNLRQVSNDIAHDLRTPLARQQQVLETALSNELDAAGYRHAITNAAELGRDMLELFAALLRISEIESHELRKSFTTVDLSEIAERVTEAFRPDIEEAGHLLVIDIAPRLSVLGDRQLLSQLLANLLENALRHTPRGTRVVVAVTDSPDGVALHVSDNGPGIPGDQRAFVLRRLARLEQARSTAGHGLGLSLVDAIARVHRATLTLGNAEPGLAVTAVFGAHGSTVTLAN